MLFHKKVGLPTTLALPQGRRKLVLTHHALDQARRDRYGDFSEILRSLHTSFDPANAEVIEVETEGNDRVQPKKILYKIALSPKDDDRRLTLALVPEGPVYVAKTCWLNENNDTHKTLNLLRYSKP